jgi:outer membrane lipoprotein-sorting protein
MRGFILAAVIALIVTVPAFGQANEAEKLFRDMEQKIRTAKSLKVVGKSVTVQKGRDPKEAAWDEWRADGTMFVVSGNKLRFEGKGNIGFKSPGEDEPMLFVMNGDKIWTHKGVRDADPRMSETFCALLARGGIAVMFFGAQEFRGKADAAVNKILDAELPASNFKLKKKEMLNGREALVIEYRLTMAGKANQVTLWLDAKTNMPLKRQIKRNPDDKEGVDEVYSELLLNPTLDAKLFELPKEKNER